MDVTVYLSAVYEDRAYYAQVADENGYRLVELLEVNASDGEAFPDAYTITITPA